MRDGPHEPFLSLRNRTTRKFLVPVFGQDEFGIVALMACLCGGEPRHFLGREVCLEDGALTHTLGFQCSDCCKKTQEFRTQSTLKTAEAAAHHWNLINQPQSPAESVTETERPRIGHLSEIHATSSEGVTVQEIPPIGAGHGGAFMEFDPLATLSPRYHRETDKTFLLTHGTVVVQFFDADDDCLEIEVLGQGSLLNVPRGVRYSLSAGQGGALLLEFSNRCEQGDVVLLSGFESDVVQADELR